jgi:hypothetical protein
MELRPRDASDANSLAFCLRPVCSAGVGFPATAVTSAFVISGNPEAVSQWRDPDPIYVLTSEVVKRIRPGCDTEATGQTAAFTADVNAGS